MTDGQWNVEAAGFDVTMDPWVYLPPSTKRKAKHGMEYHLAAWKILTTAASQRHKEPFVRLFTKEQHGAPARRAPHSYFYDSRPQAERMQNSGWVELKEEGGCNIFTLESEDRPHPQQVEPGTVEQWQETSQSRPHVPAIRVGTMVQKNTSQSPEGALLRGKIYRRVTIDPSCRPTNNSRVNAKDATPIDDFSFVHVSVLVSDLEYRNPPPAPLAVQADTHLVSHSTDPTTLASSTYHAGGQTIATAYMYPLQVTIATKVDPTAGSSTSTRSIACDMPTESSTAAPVDASGFMANRHLIKSLLTDTYQRLTQANPSATADQLHGKMKDELLKILSEVETESSLPVPGEDEQLLLGESEGSRMQFLESLMESGELLAPMED